MPSDNTRKILWGTVALVLTVLFFVVKYAGPLWVTNLFENDIQSLSNLCGSDPGFSLSFYQGVMEEKYLGPAAMVLIGGALLILCFHFFRHSSGRTFGLIVFGYFLVSRFEVLFFPPYGDTASGPFMEALWLLHHNFDYAGLANQPGFTEGGPKVYLFSIYPTYLALMYKLIPNVKTFLVVNHLLVFFFGAVTISAFRNVLLKVFDDRVALLGAFILLSLPLFQAQVEAINMEMPLMMFALLTLWYLAQKRIGLACMMSMLAVMVKGVGIFLCGTVFAVSVLLFLLDEKHRGKWSTLLWGVVAVAFLVIQTAAAMYVFSRKGDIPMIESWSGWPWMQSSKATYIFLFSFFIFVLSVIREGTGHFMKKEPALKQIFTKHFVGISFFICSMGWIAVFINSSANAYRYSFVFMPLLIFFVCFAARRVIHSGKLLQLGLTTGIIALFICSYGMCFEPIAESVHSRLERSLEYRNDLKMNIDLAAELEEKFSDYRIGAPFTIAHKLAFPELGFVKKKLEVMIYGYPSFYVDIYDFRGLKYLDLKRTVWVGLTISFLSMLEEYSIDYPVSPEDKVVKEIVRGQRKAQLFFGGIAIEKMRMLTTKASRANVTQNK